MEKLERTNEFFNWEKWFQKENLIVLILAGVLLVVISFPINKEDEKMGVGKDEIEMNTEAEDFEVSDSFQELYEYAEYLEGKLEKVLVNMKGVGNVKVMITLETSEELVVEKDEPIIRDNTTETDSNGGNRVMYKMDSGQETVFVKEGNNEIPYVSKTVLPQISGVLIVAQGAGQGNNSKSISEIAQVLFGIEAHKVKVVAME